MKSKNQTSATELSDQALLEVQGGTILPDHHGHLGAALAVAEEIGAEVHAQVHTALGHAAEGVEAIVQGAEGIAAGAVEIAKAAVEASPVATGINILHKLHGGK